MTRAPPPPGPAPAPASARAARAEPDDPPPSRTSTTSCITTGCSEQNRLYRPGRVNFCVYARPMRENGDENPIGPLASVTSCEVVSGNFHVMLAPWGIDSFGA